GATKPGDNTPGSFMRQGQQVMPGPTTVTPPYGATSKVTGQTSPGDVIGCTNGQESVDISARFIGRCMG
ncbi:hypothetical protein, partial [Cutibacterium avidum]|uniref:hypothetical protein n=1 Tax=Cutibacterium avidum TaxID=33010 RepID=UPI0022E44876